MTTSRIQGLGKGIAIQKILTNEKLQKAAASFMKEQQSHESIAEAGEQAFLALYGSKSTSSLNALRYEKFIQKVSSTGVKDDAASLPPTFAAAKFHCFRVYLQICLWKLSKTSMDPLLWGWKKEGNEFVPIMSDIQPAPDTLLRIIRCNCASDCESRSWSCRKHAMKCSIACGQCKGNACTNSEGPIIAEDVDDCSD